MFLLALTSTGCAFLALIFFSIWIAFKIIRRTGSKAGCLGIGYISLVVFCISMFACMITYFLFSYTFSKAEGLFFGENCIAEVVDVDEVKGVDEEGNSYTNYYPVYQFTTKAGGSLIRKSDESTLSGRPQKGSTKRIHYYAQKDRITTLGATTIVAICGMLLMGTVLIFSFVGIMMYALGHKMDKFGRICAAIGSSSLYLLL